MIAAPIPAGPHMAAEIAQSREVFLRAAMADHRAALAPLGLAGKRALYTVARGSSDAAANILSYEMMRELGMPVTSLPPSVFSIGAGVDMNGAAALVISQSGASDDLVRSARGIRASGGAVVAITNQPGSPVEAESDLTLAIDAGPELAVPATKTVVGSVAAGAALLAGLSEGYGARLARSVTQIAGLPTLTHPRADELRGALLRAQHVYVIGRDTGFGAAHELALKIKETCALHAEAYSASEVLHGPLQLATKGLTVLILDTGAPEIQGSLDTAEARLRGAGQGTVLRVSPADLGAGDLVPAAAAALLLMTLYPVIHAATVALGLNPDRPAQLSKVTQTT